MEKISRILKGITFIVFALILIGALAAVAYRFVAFRASQTEPHRLTVVATLFPYYDFARAVAGEDADVVLLLPPGVEAHAYEPKPSDVLHIQNADLFIYTGSFMEPWAESILQGTESGTRRVINASDGIALINEEDPQEAEEHHGVDPHIWLDCNNDIRIANRIAEQLKALDPVNADAYEQRRQMFESDLLQLDAAYAEKLASCRTRTFVQGGHRSFGYLAKRYNLDYLAAVGVNDDTEPTVKELLNLINIVHEKGIKYIYSEELTSPRYAETIARETGAAILLLNAAHNVSRDDFEAGVTFMGIMRANLEKLARGLECD